MNGGLVSRVVGDWEACRLTSLARGVDLAVLSFARDAFYKFLIGRRGLTQRACRQGISTGDCFGVAVCIVFAFCLSLCVCFFR